MKSLLFSFLILLNLSSTKAQEWKTYLAWQIALEENNFSTGLLDGIWGVKSQKALDEFIIANQLTITGSWRTDENLKQALGLQPIENVLSDYVISQEDVDSIMTIPDNWIEKARLERMGHENLEEVIQEKFKCSKNGLRRFNSGVDINQLLRGAIVKVPNIKAYKAVKISSLAIDLINKELSAYDDMGRKILFVYCSVAKSKEKFPGEDARVINKAMNPNYTFNPKYWPEIDYVDSVLIIKPGPKNPVGVAWMGLSLPGYGIHGTPIPDNIGKTGSHGCFRLTNWHARHIVTNTEIGTVVRMIGKESEANDDKPPINTEVNSESGVQSFEGDQRRIR